VEQINETGPILRALAKDGMPKLFIYWNDDNRIIRRFDRGACSLPVRLVWVRLSRFDHPDEMVSKGKVLVCQLYFWHVATYAIGRGDRTHLCCRLHLGRRFAGRDWVRSVASETLRVVGSRDGIDVHVWVVASHAADAGIGAIEAFADSQPVGRETDIHLAEPQMRHHRRPRAVALAAEIRQTFRRHGTQVRWNGAEFGLHGVRHVPAGAGVAMLAGYTGSEGGEIKLAINDGSGGMTTEAALHVLLPQFAA